MTCYLTGCTIYDFFPKTKAPKNNNEIIEKMNEEYRFGFEYYLKYGKPKGGVKT